MKLFGGSGYNQSRGSRAAASARRSKPDRFEKNKKGGKGKAVLTVFLGLLLLVAAILIYWKISTRPPSISESPDNDTQIQTGNQGVYQEEQYYTVLVVGEDQLGLNTDTIMLARLDTVEKTLNVVSLPRDTVINTPSGISKKINAAYYINDGGIEFLMDQVARLAGFRPNNYVVVDMDVFTGVVDAMGGVEFDVPVDMDYDDLSLLGNGQSYEFTIHVNKGLQTLNGYDALGVFRFRQNNDGSGYGMGDIQRLQCQHELLMAIAKKAMETRDISALMGIASTVIDHCETDLSMGNIQWFAEKFLQMSMDDIHFYTAPSTGCWIENVAYVTLNVDEWVDMINARVNPYSKEITAKDCALLYLDKEKSLINGQLYIEPKELAITNGEDVYTNYPILLY